MTYSDIHKANLVRVFDPILAQDSKIDFPVLNGGVETNERVYSSNNFSMAKILQFIICTHDVEFVHFTALANAVKAYKEVGKADEVVAGNE